MQKPKASVTILLEGYTSEEKNGHSCSTITLIKDTNILMVVDPGSVKSPALIKKALQKEGLSCREINMVCITHSHIDHYRQIGLFPKAKILDYWGWWEKDFWSEAKTKISPNISVLQTPGHSNDSITLLVHTKIGVIAICGDLFWKQALPQKDPYASNQTALEKNRKLVLSKADFIIPGHGKMFKV